MALVLGGCATGVEPATSPAITGTPEDIVRRYHAALHHICETGVTPESVELYRAVARLWDAQPTGGGRGSNFGGARHPEMAWQACFQSPGWD